MKIELDLTKMWSGDDFGTTVAEIIRQEIDTAIRNAVKAEIKTYRDQIQKEVARVAKDALAKLRSESIKTATRKMMESL